ncbi:hypothetical protein NIES3974_04100 [Calothrix sp. NIES-3974]|nr:hypothetical protein NIES3974_04100 [Calothrix sp. NIES-3974]
MNLTRYIITYRQLNYELGMRNNKVLENSFLYFLHQEISYFYLTNLSTPPEYCTSPGCSDTVYLPSKAIDYAAT